MTHKELIEQHQKDTGLCSSFHHMKSASSTYNTIIEKGEAIVPDILKYMVENKDFSGMSIVMLLMDITKESPYEPEPIKNDKGEEVKGFVGYDVHKTVEAWINWGKKKQLI